MSAEVTAEQFQSLAALLSAKEAPSSVMNLSPQMVLTLCVETARANRNRIALSAPQPAWLLCRLLRANVAVTIGGSHAP